MRAFLKVLITSLVCLAIIFLGYSITTEFTKNISATSFVFNLPAHPNITISAASDTPLDIAANGPFCLFKNEKSKIDVICSTPDPRPGTPNAVRLTTTLKTGKWLVFAPGRSTNLYLESDLPLVYNKNDFLSAIGIDAVLLFIIFIIVLMVAETNKK
ncbi:MAG: hypothetical protein WA052_00495 [Microgenomates group bacterium]